MKKHPHSIYHGFFAVVGLCFVTAFAWLLYDVHVEKKVATIYQQASPHVLFSQDIKDVIFDNTDIQAHAFIVYDINRNEVFYEKKAFAPRPLASLTKIMTGLVALDTYGPDHHIEISDNAMRQAGDTGLRAGDTWTLGELVPFMITTSSNDAATAIAEMFPQEDGLVEKMNAYAKDLGLHTLVFRNESGLDLADETPSAFGSAYDIARLTAHVLQEQSESMMTSTRDGVVYHSLGDHDYIAKNTNPIVQNLPALVASKTGYTDASGGNLSFVFEAGPQRPMAVVILGSTFTGRFEDAEHIVQGTMHVLSSM